MHSSSFQLHKTLPKAPLFLFATYLVVLCLLSFLVFPVADDYSYPLKIRNTPFWEYYLQFYNSWSGRFASNLLLPLLGSQSNNLLLYQFYPIFLITSFIASSYFFIIHFFQCTRKNAAILTLAFSATYFSGYVSMGQGVYWLSGGYTYQIAFNALVFLLGSLFCLGQSSKNSWLFHLGTIIAISIATGCNEVTMFSTGTVFLATALVAWLHNHPRRKTFLLYAMLAALLCCFAILAPGNFARIDSDTDKSSFLVWFGFVSFRALGGGFEAFKWIVLSPFPLFIAACAPFLRTPFRGKLIPSLTLKQNTILAFTILWGIFFWDYFISIWSSGKHPYARVNNAIYTDVLLGCLVFYSVYIAPKVSPVIWNLWDKQHKKLGWILLFGVFLMPDTLNIIKNTVNSDYATHYTIVSKQYSTAANAQSTKITVPTTTVAPRPIFFRHLNDERRSWILSVFADYWHLDEVQTIPSTSDK